MQNIITIDMGNNKILINTQALQIIANHKLIEDNFTISTEYLFVLSI